MSAARRCTVLLAPLGILAGHAIAYAMSPRHEIGHGADSAMHGYLHGASAVVVPLGVVALAWSISAREGRWHGVPRVVPLAAIQIVGFLGQEVVEHALAGRGIAEVVASPAIRLGVLLQVLVAVGMVLVVRAGRAVVARLREAGRPAHAPGKPVFPRGRAYSPVRTELTPLSRRGPPRAVHLVN